MNNNKIETKIIMDDYISMDKIIETYNQAKEKDPNLSFNTFVDLALETVDSLEEDVHADIEALELANEVLNKVSILSNVMRATGVTIMVAKGDMDSVIYSEFANVFIAASNICEMQMLEDKMLMEAGGNAKASYLYHKMLGKICELLMPVYIFGEYILGKKEFSSAVGYLCNVIGKFIKKYSALYLEFTQGELINSSFKLDKIEQLKEELSNIKTDLDEDIVYTKKRV